VLVQVDEPFRGAAGTVALLGLRRVNDCFAAIDYFEERGVSSMSCEGIEDIPPAPDKSTLWWRGTSTAPPTVPYLVEPGRTVRQGREVAAAS
jgi:hypothetical protein